MAPANTAICILSTIFHASLMVVEVIATWNAYNLIQDALSKDIFDNKAQMLKHKILVIRSKQGTAVYFIGSLASALLIYFSWLRLSFEDVEPSTSTFTVESLLNILIMLILHISVVRFIVDHDHAYSTLERTVYISFGLYVSANIILIMFRTYYVEALAVITAENYVHGVWYAFMLLIFCADFVVSYCKSYHIDDSIERAMFRPSPYKSIYRFQRFAECLIPVIGGLSCINLLSIEQIQLAISAKSSTISWWLQVSVIPGLSFSNLSASELYYIHISLERNRRLLEH
jgi:hypothetical protein